MSLEIDAHSALIGALVTVAVMTGTLLRRRRRRSDALFVIFCVVLVLWFLATFLRGLEGVDPWLRVELGVAALIPATMIQLFADLMPWNQGRVGRLLGWAYPLSGLMVVAAASPLGGLPPVQIAIGGAVLLTVLFISYLMSDAGDAAKGTVEYARRRYLTIGASAVTVLAFCGEIPGLRGSLSAAGHLAVMLYVFFLSQVLLRERLLDLNEFLGRMVILGILAALFATIIALLIGLGTDTSTRLFGAIIGVIILLTLYEPLKDRLETKAVELFFRERHRFVSAMEELRRRMQHGVLEPARMSRILVDALYDARRATHVAVYLLEPMGNGFALEAFRGPEPGRRVGADEHPALWHAIQQNRAPLLTEQLSREVEGEEQASKQRDLIDALRAVSADLLIPFVSGETVLGFLALRDDRSVEPYSTSEIAHLMKLGDTASTVIWNSRLAERLRERERLAAIGSMAAGLAHEIRNPLGAIKGAAEYLGPESFNQEQGEFLQVIIEETNRLNSVVSQFLDYAKPFRASFQSTDLNEVLKKTAKLVEARNPERQTPVELRLDEKLPEIQADSEQLKQVILNLVLNGLEASEGTGRPVVLTTRHAPERAFVELRVRDYGSGISPENLERIFIPFFTTKSQGTGLGLAVCHRIITNHGGSIHPESRLGVGTEFVIQLPLQQREGVSSGNTGSFPRLAPARGSTDPRGANSELSGGTSSLASPDRRPSGHEGTETPGIPSHET